MREAGWADGQPGRSKGAASGMRGTAGPHRLRGERQSGRLHAAYTFIAWAFLLQHDTQNSMLSCIVFFYITKQIEG